MFLASEGRFCTGIEVLLTGGCSAGVQVQGPVEAPPWRPLLSFPDLPHFRAGFPDRPLPLQTQSPKFWLLPSASGCHPQLQTLSPFPVCQSTPQVPTKAIGSQKEEDIVTFIFRPL